MTDAVDTRQERDDRARSLGAIRDHLLRLMPPGGRARRLVGWGVVAWTTIGLGILLWVLWRGLERIAGVFPYLVMALVVVFVLNPPVKALVRRGVPRRLAATVVFLLALVLVSAILGLMVPAIGHQAQSLVAGSRGLIDKGGGLFARLSDSTNPILRGVGNTITHWIQDHAGTVQDYLRTVTGAGLKLAHAGLVLLLGGFLGFLLLLSLPDATRSFAGLVTRRGQEQMRAPLAEVRRILAGYIRARLIVSAVVGTLATIGLWAIHMPFWLVLGIFVGIANLIPMFGSYIGGAPVALVALLAKPPSFLILVGIVIVLSHMVDGFILSPIVLKETTNLHPVVVLLAVVVGAELFGFWGILAAIPVAGIAQFGLREWVLPRWLGTELTDEPPPMGGPATGVPG